MSKAMGVFAVVAIGSALGVGAAFCPDDCCLMGKGSCGVSAAMAQETTPHCGGAQTAGAKQEGKPGCTAGQTTGGGCCASKTAGQDAKSGCCAGMASAKAEGCPKTAMCDKTLASMPKMMYRVGEKELCCPNGAGEEAKTSGKPIQYVVAGEVFAAEGDAKVKLVSAVETYNTDLLTMQFSAGSECFKCPVTAEEAAKKAGAAMKYRTAGMDFDSKEKAVQALEAAKKAAGEVKLAAFVGDKEFGCCVEAGKVAKETGKEVTYVVGDQKTCCEITGKLNFAMAKAKAIVSAAAELALATGAQTTTGA
ncbi:MAG: hypothetical protein IT449_10760 [Phycisphaerales bacterium]|nr:hypothetical protein [Phycisphaerales bacterium]